MLTNVLTSKLTSLTFAHLTGSDRWEEWALNIKCKACKAHPNVGQHSMQTYGMVFVCLTSQYQHTLGARPQFHNSFWLWPPTHDDHHMGKHRGPPEVKLYKCLIPNGGASLQFLLRARGESHLSPWSSREVLIGASWVHVYPETPNIGLKRFKSVHIIILIFDVNYSLNI